MAWAEVVKWNTFDAVAAAARRIREALVPGAAPVPAPAAVPACRCSGRCHFGNLVPYLLQRQIELECEFYRDVH